VHYAGNSGISSVMHIYEYTGIHTVYVLLDQNMCVWVNSPL